MHESEQALRNAFDDGMTYYIDDEVTGLPVVGSVGFAYVDDPGDPTTLDTRVCETAAYTTDWQELDTAPDDPDIGAFYFTAVLTDTESDERIGVTLWDDMARLSQEDEELSFSTFSRLVEHLETVLGTGLRLAYNGR